MYTVARDVNIACILVDTVLGDLLHQQDGAVRAVRAIDVDVGAGVLACRATTLAEFTF